MADGRDSHFDGLAARAPSGLGDVVRPKPVLNPFEVYQQGQGILLEELRALSRDRLRDIALAYEFASQAGADVASREELTAIIVGGVLRPSGSELAPDDLTSPR
ncbi:MAG: hypothetical protein WD801_00190 [Gemmatimonadaceae bacterium]